MKSCELYERLAARLREDTAYRGRVSLNEPLARRTTMGVGGKAPLFLEPEDEESCLQALSLLTDSGLPCFVLGGGSNVIISDEGFSGAVLSTRALRKIRLMETEKGEKRIEVAAGASWGSVMHFCREQDLGGLEAFTGLSGTVGGAVYMNASCFGLATADRLLSVSYASVSGGSPAVYSASAGRKAADWGYKRSPFQGSGVLGAESKTMLPLGEGVADKPEMKKGAGLPAGPHQENDRLGSEGEASPLIILSAVFSVTSSFDQEKSRACLESRRQKGHFLKPSSGSTFKNTPELPAPAGKVIDDCGLKGFRIGGAQIAPWHGNIVINAGGASAGDIRSLVEAVQRLVKEKCGCDLQPEVLFCGKWPASGKA